MPERQAATALLLKHWGGRPVPVRPEEIARAEGVRVEHITDHAYSGEYVQEQGIPVIRYNEWESANRQRFTIAHELGHHVLKHGPRLRDTTAALFGNSWDPVEVSANRFAAELLMPVYAVTSMVRTQGVSSLEILANTFAVSEQAMKYRLKNLGLI
jgi:Zn-dependent peptidase ImmA (M78 family)